jgi:hypothetical protein
MLFLLDTGCQRRAVGRRVAQALDLAGITHTVGAPSFAQFAKGGSRVEPYLPGYNTASECSSFFSTILIPKKPESCDEQP